MLVDPSNSAARSTVAGAIRQASQATGASFHYLLATAQVESGLNPQAGASTSSARGLFQFIEQTWLATMKQAGPALGYGRYAEAISTNASGHYEVRNPFLRGEILKLRNDPTANAAMAGAFTNANAAILNQRLGRLPSEGELYIAHFLGAGGAARLITLAASRPNAKATDFFPHAAHANSSIFYDRTTGAARTVAQVRNVLTARYDVARRVQDQPAALAQAASGPLVAAAGPAGPAAAAGGPAAGSARVATAATAVTATTAAGVPLVPDTAGIAKAFAAAIPRHSAHDTQVFHSLFRDVSGNAPAAPLVDALAGVPSVAASGQGAAPRSPTSGAGLDLFTDPVEKS